MNAANRLWLSAGMPLVRMVPRDCAGMVRVTTTPWPSSRTNVARTSSGVALALEIRK